MDSRKLRMTTGKAVLAAEVLPYRGITLEDLMKLVSFTLALVLFCGVLSADVISGTLHSTEAQLVDNLMEDCGVYSGRVKILIFESLVVYVVEFPGDYFSWKSDNDVAELCSFLVAVAYVSEKTSWNSDAVIALYEDDTIGMLTEDCRTAVRLKNDGFDITSYLQDNVMIGDRETSQLRL